MPAAPLRQPQGDERRRFAGEPDRCPPVGGCVGLTQPHSNYLLPPEVVLYEPTASDIYEGGVPCAPGKQFRLIFLNTPLLENELQQLLELHRALEQERGSEAIPEYVRPHVMRILQHRKGDVKKALAVMRTHASERVARLPIPESDVLSDLRNGFAYWHGRDKSCRPCLVIILARMREFKHDKERAIRLVMFVLEYGLRYCMAPGRVENWVVLIDMTNISQVVGLSNFGSTIHTISTIAQNLSDVYCGRMAWLRIFNVPGFLRKLVQAAIPADKARKVSFTDPAEAQNLMRELMEPHQLEARFGGSAPDTRPEEVYPFRFFPNATGDDHDSAHHNEELLGSLSSSSMHQFVEPEFYNGALWDSSTDKARDEWFFSAPAPALTPASASGLSAMPGAGQVEPCSTLSRWLYLVNPAQAQRCIEDTPSVKLVGSTFGWSRTERLRRSDSCMSKMSERFGSISSLPLSQPPGAEMAMVIRSASVESMDSIESSTPATMHFVPSASGLSMGMRLPRSDSVMSELSEHGGMTLLTPRATVASMGYFGRQGSR